jgi:hypothetical protein
MKIVTESEQLSVSIIQHGNADILSVQAPSDVEANTPFDITYNVKNIGTVDDMIFGRVKDTVTGDIITGTEWSEVINAMSAVSKTATIPGYTPPGPIQLTIEVGYISS